LKTYRGKKRRYEGAGRSSPTWIAQATAQAQYPIKPHRYVPLL